MRIFLNILLFVTSVSWTVEINLGRRYHKEIGIPLAKHIKITEEATNRNRRSTGGGIASLYTYPYVAGLIIMFEDDSGVSVCSASLLSQQHLVSAAHCWFDGEEQALLYIVVLGSENLFKGGLRLTTYDVVQHPEFSPYWLRNDISIIYLPNQIYFSDKIQPVALPSIADLSKTFVGYQAVVIGFGKTSNGEDDSLEEQSRMMSRVKVKVITNALCGRSYFEPIFPCQICTSGLGGVGICDGDSGGPLVIRTRGKHILIGIASFAGVASCPLQKPSGFTRVTKFYDFILNHIY